MEGFEEFMAEMLEEYNYDKDTIMVTTAFAQALADEWGKQLLIQRVSNQRELLFAEKGDYVTYIGGGRGKYLKLGKKYEVQKDCNGEFIIVNNEIGRRQIYNTHFFSK